MTDPSETDRDRLVAAVEAFMDRYHAAFEHGTRDDLQELVHLPVAYISEEEVQLRERYPFDPVRMREATGFHHAEAVTRVVHVETGRAHVVIEGTRHRADGSVIESIDAFYILHDRGDGWKVSAFSGIRGAR
jgi:hypothetical protein